MIKCICQMMIWVPLSQKWKLSQLIRIRELWLTAAQMVLTSKADPYFPLGLRYPENFPIGSRYPKNFTIGQGYPLRIVKTHNLQQRHLELQDSHWLPSFGLYTTILPPRRKTCFTQMKKESLWKISFAQAIPNKSDRYDLTKRPCDAVVFYFIDLFSI